MLSWTKEICPVFAELRIAKGEELVVAISYLDAIKQRPINSSKDLIVSLFIGARIDFPL